MIAARSPHGSPRRGGTTLDDPNQPGDRTRPPTDAGTSGSPPAGDVPGSRTGTSAPDADPPGLGAQIGSTRAAVVALGKAHADLAKAELADIADEVKRTAALAGLAFGLLIVVATLLTIGTILFVGEWLFGSLGWGVVHGALFLSGLAVAAILVALGVPGRRVVTDYAVAVVVAVLAAVLLGLNLPNQLWTGIGNALGLGIDVGSRPLVVGVAGGAILIGILGLIGGTAAAGARGGTGGLVAGLILGAILGAVSAVTYGWPVAVALGIALGLVVWLVLLARRASTIDFAKLQERFTPRQTIDTTKETIEWVRARTPLGPRS